MLFRRGWRVVVAAGACLEGTLFRKERKVLETLLRPHLKKGPGNAACNPG